MTLTVLSTSMNKAFLHLPLNNFKMFIILFLGCVFSILECYFSVLFIHTLTAECVNA